MSTSATASPATETIHVRLESEQLPSDHIQIFSLSGREAISQLFSFEIGIVCLRPDEINPASMEGADVTLVFERKDKEIRRVHGMIAEIQDMLDGDAGVRTFRIRVVPRAFRLTLVRTQDIYMDMSLPDIIRKKLELVQLGSQDVAFRLIDDYPKLEFVVQYKETDLAFISRLCEHAGVSFYFDHEDGRDVIVFADYVGGFRALEGRDAAPFRGRGEKQDVFKIASTTRLIPRAHIAQDYNYRTPLIDLSESADAPSGFAGGVVEYGEHVKTTDAAQKIARIRAEESESAHHVFEGESNLPGLTAGAPFELEGHARLGQMRLLVTAVEHHTAQPVATHGIGEGEHGYKNRFHAIDAALTYRPPRVTPRPRIHGVISAVVEGDGLSASGVIAPIDKEGRYVVRFLFDTAPAGERKASRPVRMAQPHVGADYGMHMPLKPGVEVLLAFIDGDPDRPIIMSAVPDAIHPTPVTQRHADTSRIKTAAGIIIEIKDA
jgi:type VI secretion system secreted protein VgrG